MSTNKPDAVPVTPEEYKCLEAFPADSAWQRYRNGAHHEELLVYAIRQHKEKLDAERWREEDEREAELKLAQAEQRAAKAEAAYSEACITFDRVIAIARDENTRLRDERDKYGSPRGSAWWKYFYKGCWVNDTRELEAENTRLRQQLHDRMYGESGSALQPTSTDTPKEEK